MRAHEQSLVSASSDLSQAPPLHRFSFTQFPMPFVTLPPRMSVGEKGMVVNMQESGMPPMEISQSTGRGFSIIYRTINDVMSGRVAAPVGRPKELHSQEVDRILQVLRVMVQEADGRWEVTLAMLMKRAKVKFSEGTVRAAMHKRRIWFRVMRSKPKLTQHDIKDRCAFGKKYCKKKASWWVKHLHLVIDLKKFPVFTNAKGRNYAAAREVRGVYRGPGEGLDQGYVRVGKEQRCGSGVKGVMVAAGIGNGRVRLWHPIDGNWCGAAADNLYRRPMLRTLQKSHPTRKTFNVLEDNDPTGLVQGRDAGEEGGGHPRLRNPEAQPRPQPLRLWVVEGDQQEDARGRAEVPRVEEGVPERLHSPAGPHRAGPPPDLHPQAHRRHGSARAPVARPEGHALRGGRQVISGNNCLHISPPHGPSLGRDMKRAHVDVLTLVCLR